MRIEGGRKAGRVLNLDARPYICARVLVRPWPELHGHGKLDNCPWIFLLTYCLKRMVVNVFSWPFVQTGRPQNSALFLLFCFFPFLSKTIKLWMPPKKSLFKVLSFSLAFN